MICTHCHELIQKCQFTIGNLEFVGGIINETSLFIVEQTLLDEYVDPCLILLDRSLTVDTNKVEGKCTVAFIQWTKTAYSERT